MRKSDEKFAAAFREAGMEEFAKRAEAGEFNEFFGPHACPMVYLVDEMQKIGSVNALKLRARIMNGDFDDDGTDSEEWAKSPEGQETFGKLLKGE